MSGKTGGDGSSAGASSGVAKISTRARRQADMQREFAEKQHRIAMLRRRINLAQSGVHAYKNKRIPEAARCFHAYLHILEDWKGVPEGGLLPSHFDMSTDITELLLISGVYWDLAKIYDRTRSKAKQREFSHCLEKYILFSKDMPFQHVCLETMRKYISNDKPVHKDAFKQAYTIMGGKPDPCFVATSLVDVCRPETVGLLREFRDQRLSRTRLGRAFTRWYYRNGPKLANWADHQPDWLRRAMGKILDWVAANL